MYARLYMLPFLMAEEERDLYRREMAQVAREREVMKDVEGWNVRSPLPRSFVTLLILSTGEAAGL